MGTVSSKKAFFTFSTVFLEIRFLEAERLKRNLNFRSFAPIPDSVSQRQRRRRRRRQRQRDSRRVPEQKNLTLFRKPNEKKIASPFWRRKH